MSSVVEPLRQVRRGVMEALLPSQCLGCRTPVGDQGLLCADCWETVPFIARPFCEQCCLPFAYHDDAGVCAGCLRDRPAFLRTRAIMEYDGGARRLILAFKHGDQTHAAQGFGRWLARAAADIAADAEAIVPVPLHWTRLLQRRFNQAALLARVLARESATPLLPDALTRRRPTPSQGSLGRQARRDNVRGAFQVRAGRGDRIRGRQVLLVDDVMTTGATADACARALLRAGAVAVDVAVLARVGAETGAST